MVRLTPELIEQCAQYTNPVRDRELDLRGYKIPVIENMGATLDQFDTVDLSDNEIRKLDGFPLLRRLKNVIINNNRVVRFGEHLEESIPMLESIILSNNNIQDLADLDNLASVKTLKTISLMRNPVTTKKHYRLYVAFKLPHVRLLDFRKIKMKEREAASKLFKSKKGQALVRDIAKRTKTFTPGAGLPSEKKPTTTGTAPVANGTTTNGQNTQDIAAIKAAIANANTLEEVERLNALLQSGQIPGVERPPTGAPAEEMET